MERSAPADKAVPHGPTGGRKGGEPERPPEGESVWPTAIAFLGLFGPRGGDGRSAEEEAAQPDR
jgi:hypothetical protein